jgi:hypothetical protein
MQPALTARNLSAMQQAALAARKVFMCLHAAEQRFAFCPKWRYAVRSIGTPLGLYPMLIIFYEEGFWLHTFFVFLYFKVLFIERLQHNHIFNYTGHSVTCLPT